MTILSNTIFEKFQARKTRKQKTAFINFMRGNIPNVKVEEGGLLKSRNIVVGDVAKADVVYTAHYDTCARLPFPNFIAPKNIPVYILYNCVIAACLLCLYYIFFTIVFTAITILGILDIPVLSPVLAFIAAYLEFLLTPLLLTCLGLLYFGPANKSTANDNTSGVITLCEIYDALTEKERERAAFVFFDHEELGMFGSRFFRKKHKEEMKEKLLINLDCVSSGDTIMLVMSKKAEQKYGEKIKAAYEGEGNGKKILFESASKTFYPSDQSGFRYGVGVAAFKESKTFGLYMDKIHTKKDTEWDEQNIECIAACSAGLVKMPISP